MKKEIINNKIVVILGATSSGKTGLAVKLADAFSGEIVSADSRQVYRGMDIGTGKDLPDYTIVKNGRKKQIKYHLIDVASPKSVFSLAKYQQLAFRAIDDILARGKLPLVVGGSGLYLQALVDNYSLAKTKPDTQLRLELESLTKEDLQARLKKINPKFFAKLNNSDKNNPRRLVRYIEIFSAEAGFKAGAKKSKYDFLILGLSCPQEELNKRIKQRLLSRLDEGLIDEIKGLHKSGVSYDRLEKFGLEYRHGAWFLQGKMDYDTMVDHLNQAICRFSKKQAIWFKRWQKQKRQIHWLEGLTDAKKLIKDFLKS
ncbi:MAG TPA: tRNA (adenosine(37)-N6)-dimethylallyltransferase MiaA [bacterium]|nr:tRNA (adenosine(37)-N6)-dimethylallyltransferase MiaA [bacterium]HPT29727.1 tRNA (adenosine(37)-N6)-dimethylallyltransferase MiaA [bacterium]